MRREKFLIVTTIPDTLEAFLLPHARELKTNGWQVDCLANGAAENEKCQATFDHCYNITWSRSPFSIHNFIESPRIIRSLVQEEGYDVVHVHTPVASFITRFALRQLRKKTGTSVVYTAHGFHFYKGGNFIKNALFLFLEKLAAPWTDQLEVINEEDYQAAIRYLLPRKQVLFKKDGVGLDHSYYNAEAVTRVSIQKIRKDIGLGNSGILFTMIAEFNKGKRHADLIRAFAMLEDRRAHLVFLGKGRLMGQCKKLCEELGIAARVHFMGHVADVRPYILASCATVLPSEREGLPRSVMESLALGVPVIGADTRGIRDLISRGNGWIVPVGEVRELARAMKNVLDSLGS